VDMLEKYLDITDKIEEHTRKIEETEKNIREHERSISTLSTKLKEIDVEMSLLKDLPQKHGFENLEEAYEELMKMYNEYMNAKRYVEEKREEYENNMKRYKELKLEISSMKEELQSMMKSISKFIGEDLSTYETLDNLSNTVLELLKKMKTTYERLSEETNALRVELGSLQGTLKNDKERIAALREEIIRLQKDKEKLLRIVKELKDKVLERIKEASLKILQEALARLSVYTTEYLRTFIGDKDIKVKFNIELTGQHGRNINVKLTINYEGSAIGWENLSGGEQTALAFSIRLALARVLGKYLGLLILDEPTEHLDEERVDTIRELIQELQKGVHGRKSQIILVSHERSLTNIENARIIKFEITRRPNKGPVSVVTIHDS
ncbi:MAG: AAA family ATPase, partial [Euryarchaeota archaeon]|nr:AAA family ATPase [Euryarchaeota archaeon]